MSTELTVKQLEVVSKTAIEAYRKEQRENELQKEKKRLYNAKVLLHNYRRLNLYRKKMQERIAAGDNEADTDPYVDLNGEHINVEAISKSTKKTLALMNFIDDMLYIYELNCSRSNDELKIRQYKTLYHFYIAEGKMTYEQIGELLDVNARTSRRDLQEAVREMAVLFFGVDGLRLAL